MDKIDINRNRVVKVKKHEVVGQETRYEFFDEYGKPVPESAYIADVYGEWHTVTMTYEDLCYDLGFDPDVNFVEVTKAGSITWTLGKPEEIHALFRAIEEKGYKAKSSRNR